MRFHMSPPRRSLPRAAGSNATVDARVFQ